MQTIEKDIYIKITVPKAEVEATEGPYFHIQGELLEERVKENDVPNCLEAWFTGFEVMPQVENNLQEGEAATITAKLFYHVLVQVG
ncbi:hypothetical protein ACL9RF_17260 [Sphingobacterium sp. Mn56C]|uniref:hypothetical protein n=1 Tax=Sphingobacterium sp. Mn56C TaxID=3395261 RepID=UPI003BD41436